MQPTHKSTWQNLPLADNITGVVLKLHGCYMAEHLKGRLYCGTSNITLPGNKTSFPEAFRNETRLHYYASLFNSLEINSSFYKVPLPRTFTKWANEVGDEFRFAIKLWKGITHNKGLAFTDAEVDKFMNAIAGCAGKTGPLLIQLPKSTRSDNVDSLNALLSQIRSAELGKNLLIAVEFRDTSWYSKSIFSMLNKYGASLVRHDMPGSAPGNIINEARFEFLRFHGEKGDYRSSYTQEFLNKKAADVNRWLNEGKDVYAYFNNTIGNAYQNALEFKEYIWK